VTVRVRAVQSSKMLYVLCPNWNVFDGVGVGVGVEVGVGMFEADGV